MGYECFFVNKGGLPIKQILSKFGNNFVVLIVGKKGLSIILNYMNYILDETLTNSYDPVKILDQKTETHYTNAFSSY